MKTLRVTILISLSLAACPGSPPEHRPPRDTSTAAPVDPAKAATISGRVLLQGVAPNPEGIRMGADPTCARMHTEPVQAEELVVNPDGSLRNAFVYVKEGLEDRVFTAPKEPVVLEQQGCVYVPHVLGIVTGQSLEIVNKDPTLHNVRSVSKRNRPFNIGQPMQGSVGRVTFQEPEVMVLIKCDVHRWMSAYLGVLDHPYFDVTGDGGHFELSPLPPGEFLVEAWHETLGTKTERVIVTGREKREVEFVFSASSDSQHVRN